MAHQRVYKNISYETEPTWGASLAGNARRLQVLSSSLALNPNKALVEDTQTSIKGRDRMTIGRNEIDGDIVTYAHPNTIDVMFEWVNGVAGTTATLGTSAIIKTYNQNTVNNYLSRTVNLDRNQSQEKFAGVRATKLSLEFSDGLVEMNLTTFGKTRTTGVSLVDSIGETVKPFEFADMTVSVGGPAFAGVAAVPVSSFSLEYDNASERTFLSGSRDASRTDGGIPTLTGSFEIFHEGTSYISPTFGCSELSIRLEATTVSCHGLIAGVTPYYLKLDIPKVQFTSNVRPYEQAGLAMETIEWTAIFNPGTSALWTPQLTAGYDLATI